MASGSTGGLLLLLLLTQTTGRFYGHKSDFIFQFLFCVPLSLAPIHTTCDIQAGNFIVLSEYNLIFTEAVTFSMDLNTFHCCYNNSYCETESLECQVEWNSSRLLLFKKMLILCYLLKTTTLSSSQFKYTVNCCCCCSSLYDLQKGVSPLTLCFRLCKRPIPGKVIFFWISGEKNQLLYLTI